MPRSPGRGWLERSAFPASSSRGQRGDGENCTGCSRRPLFKAFGANYRAVARPRASASRPSVSEPFRIRELELDCHSSLFIEELTSPVRRNRDPLKPHADAVPSSVLPALAFRAPGARRVRPHRARGRGARVGAPPGVPRAQPRLHHAGPGGGRPSRGSRRGDRRGVPGRDQGRGAGRATAAAARVRARGSRYAASWAGSTTSSSPRCRARSPWSACTNARCR